MITINDCRQANERYFKGVSNDILPVNCSKNSLFLSLNKGVFYYFDGTNWKRIGG